MNTEEREAEQRSVLSQLAELEAEDARLYARRMELRAHMDELWTDGPQEQFGVIELAGTARIGQGRASTQLINGNALKTTPAGHTRCLARRRDVHADGRAAAGADQQLHP